MEFIVSILTLYFLGLVMYNLSKETPEDEEIDDLTVYLDLIFPVVAAMMVNIFGIVYQIFF